MRLTRFGCGAAVAAALAVAGPAMAQDGGDRTVTLRSFDGFTQLRGELVEFSNGVYVIDTRLGTLEVDANQVECDGPACPALYALDEEFGVFGSNTIGAALMPALIEGYAEELGVTLVRELGAEDNERLFRLVNAQDQELAAIDLESRGSGTSYAALADGRAAIGMSSRQIDEDEVTLLGDAGIPDPRDTEFENVVALDGLLIITHQDNPIKSISLSEIAQVFAGQITNWSELGGPDMDITVYASADGSGALGTFDSLVLAPNGAEVAGDALRFDSNA